MLYLDALKFEPVANIINKYICHRKLVLLGDSTNLRNLLFEEYQLEPEHIAIQVKGDLEKGNEYRMLSDFNNKADEYYICIPCLQYSEELKSKLENYGYEEYKDYVFALHKRIILPPRTKNYEDEYGNRVISSGDFKVILSPNAGNNVVDIDEKTTAMGEAKIIMEDEGGQIQIERNCRFGFDALFVIHSHSKIYVQEKCSFTRNFEARVSACCDIDIGRDCQFSFDVLMYAGDGHSIFDVGSHTRINECYPHNEKNDIIIGEHVWGGARCTILSSKIGKNSIIGAAAVVKGKLPEYCVAVGNPAIVKKTGVTWRRNNYARSIEECGEKSFQNTLDFIEYIDMLASLKKHIIIIAVKDTIGFSVGKEGYETLKKLGLKKLGDGNDNRFCHWKGYVAILSEGAVLYEELSMVDECVNVCRKIGKIELDILSAPLNAGNTASIIVNGGEYAIDKRGFNIVVVSSADGTVLDSIAFDTHIKERSGIRASTYFQNQIQPKAPNTMLIRNINKVKERLKLENLLPDYETRKNVYQMVHVSVKVKVRIFFWGDYPLWNAMQSVVEAFMKDVRFEVLIVCYTNEIDTFACVRQFGSYIQYNKYDIQADEPDIAIYNAVISSENSNSVKLRVFIPSINIDGMVRDMQYSNEFWQKKLRDKMKADICFCEKNLYKRFQGIDTGAEWVLSGNPKMDLIYEKTKFPPQIPVSWEKLKDKRVILWAFDHNWDTTGVTFDLYAQAFFRHLAEQKEMGLIIRPHANYPKELVRERIWTKQDIQQLKQYCENTPNIVWDDSFDYGLAYSMADAVITDINCGITISALPLEVPIAVLQRFDGYPGVPQYPDVMEAMYQITGHEELFAFFEMVLKGEDILKESRQAIKEEYIANFDGKNGQRIKDKIVEMYEERVKEGEQKK